MAVTRCRIRFYRIDDKHPMIIPIQHDQLTSVGDLKIYIRSIAELKSDANDLSLWAEDGYMLPDKATLRGLIQDMDKLVVVHRKLAHEFASRPDANHDPPKSNQTTRSKDAVSTSTPSATLQLDKLTKSRVAISSSSSSTSSSSSSDDDDSDGSSSDTSRPTERPSSSINTSRHTERPPPMKQMSPAAKKSKPGPANGLPGKVSSTRRRTRRGRRGGKSAQARRAKQLEAETMTSKEKVETTTTLSRNGQQPGSSIPTPRLNNHEAIDTKSQPPVQSQPGSNDHARTDQPASETANAEQAPVDANHGFDSSMRTVPACTVEELVRQHRWQPLETFPRHGDTLAFKMLELTANGIPQLSKDKVARVMDMDEQAGQLRVHVLAEHQEAVTSEYGQALTANVMEEEEQDDSNNERLLDIASLEDMRIAQTQGENGFA